MHSRQDQESRDPVSIGRELSSVFHPARGMRSRSENRRVGMRPRPMAVLQRLVMLHRADRCAASTRAGTSAVEYDVERPKMESVARVGTRTFARRPAGEVFRLRSTVLNIAGGTTRLVVRLFYDVCHALPGPGEA